MPLPHSWEGAHLAGVCVCVHICNAMGAYWYGGEGHIPWQKKVGGMQKGNRGGETQGGGCSTGRVDCSHPIGAWGWWWDVGDTHTHTEGVPLLFSNKVFGSAGGGLCAGPRGPRPGCCRPLPPPASTAAPGEEGGGTTHEGTHPPMGWNDPQIAPGCSRTLLVLGCNFRKGVRGAGGGLGKGKEGWNSPRRGAERNRLQQSTRNAIFFTVEHGEFDAELAPCSIGRGCGSSRRCPPHPM